jgi:hypothetical protein
MTNLLQRFVNFATGEVTADVNNGSVATDKINGVGGPYSVEDDFSDISYYIQRKDPSVETDYTLLNISDGPKVALAVTVKGDFFKSPSTGQNGTFDVTRDGTTTQVPAVNTTPNYDDQGDDLHTNETVGPFYYNNSLKVEWTGQSNRITALARIKGSGPHFAVAVADGEEPYSVVRHVSSEQVDAMIAPDGYWFVLNPTLADELDSVWDGVWDDSQEMFVAP